MNETRRAGLTLAACLFAVGCSTLPDDAINFGDGKLLGYEYTTVFGAVSKARRLACIASPGVCEAVEVVAFIKAARARVAAGSAVTEAEADIVAETRGLRDDVLRGVADDVAETEAPTS